MTDSDAELVSRVVDGDDRVAFERLVVRHQSGLRSFLRRLVGNDFARADDLAQETFIKLFKSIGTYRGESRFSTWLYRMAYTTFIDAQRRRVVETPFDESLHSPESGAALAPEEEWDIASALRQLTDQQRAVFDLHYRNGMTHREVADVLDMPLGTVKSVLVRGLDELKALFAKRGRN